MSAQLKELYCLLLYGQCPDFHQHSGKDVAELFMKAHFFFFLMVF